jgi:serine/threonine protein kinase
LLKTIYRAYDAICQRGKGGVYRALDFSVSPVRHCILKEGRRDGETAWDGRDGHWRIKHESEVLKALAQAGVNVPQDYATFQSGDNLYLAMESIDGRNLQTLLQEKSRRLSLAAALDYGAQLARLLAAIHQAGWVWRDCKPQNLMRTKAGILRPVDFEGACLVAQPDLLPWGTPGYTPPEWGRVPDSGSRLPEDLFALGVTLHQLITGHLPKENVVAPPVEQLRRRVPLSVREVIRALLDPSPQLRPTAYVVAGLLQEAWMASRLTKAHNRL